MSATPRQVKQRWESNSQLLLRTSGTLPSPRTTGTPRISPMHLLTRAATRNLRSGCKRPSSALNVPDETPLRSHRRTLSSRLGRAQSSYRNVQPEFFAFGSEARQHLGVEPHFRCLGEPNRLSPLPSEPFFHFSEN